jgi:hypothetical protein
MIELLAAAAIHLAPTDDLNDIGGVPDATCPDFNDSGLPSWYPARYGIGGYEALHRFCVCTHGGMGKVLCVGPDPGPDGRHPDLEQDNQ